MLTSPRLFTAAAVAATVLLGVASAAPPPLTPALGARALAAAATDDDSGAAGSFQACDNADGVYAPFCQPAQNSSLYPGTTYYVTWDPSVFDSDNTTVIVEGSYVNTTSDEITAQAFSSPEMEAGRSYYAWTVDGSALPLEDTDTDTDAGADSAVFSIALVIRALVAGSNTTAQVYPGPTVVVVVAGANMTARRAAAAAAAAYRDEAPGVPTGAALYVGLPTVLGFCVLMIFGVCAWNRQARRIGLGNISGKAGGARGARMGRRMTTRRDRKQAIRLAGHDGPEDDEDEEGGRRRVKGEKGMCYQDDEEPPSHPHLSLRYEDDGWGQDWGHQREGEKEECRRKDHDGGIHVGIARRDSDALGSLAGTPTSEHFSLAQEQKKS